MSETRQRRMVASTLGELLRALDRAAAAREKLRRLTDWSPVERTELERERRDEVAVHVDR